MNSPLSPLSSLPVDLPVLAAPMAGGPSTPALVTAAARAGSLGFLAAGYKTPDQLAGQIAEVRGQARTATGTATATGPEIFGINLFVPNPVPADPAAFARYADALQAEADRYALPLDGRALDLRALAADDDGWPDKVDLLLADPVPVVSFTFGLPAPSVFQAFRRAGTRTVQTVTSAEEARQAAEAGADLLAVQASAAGGHSGTWSPDRIPAPIPLPELLAAVRGTTSVPVVAAGGLSTPDQVAAVLRAGAVAVLVGTALVRSDESGASAVYQAALADPGRGDPVVTRAFTGRPARSLPNTFTEKYGPIAPAGYPALHYLTSPLRQAATAAGDPELVNLWAGTGYRHAATGPVATILTGLASDI
ncbi:MAG TPA: nitronate monooxygenase [Streptosporangiaceae bacterium]|jgi:NAD(P)H-dependent flavin oxidoreductase YrpB (nitropropane dioxygenase family)